MISFFDLSETGRFESHRLNILFRAPVPPHCVWCASIRERLRLTWVQNTFRWIDAEYNSFRRNVFFFAPSHFSLVPLPLIRVHPNTVSTEHSVSAKRSWCYWFSDLNCKCAPKHWHHPPNRMHKKNNKLIHQFHCRIPFWHSSFVFVQLKEIRKCQHSSRGFPMRMKTNKNRIRHCRHLARMHARYVQVLHALTVATTIQRPLCQFSGWAWHVRNANIQNIRLLRNEASKER